MSSKNNSQPEHTLSEKVKQDLKKKDLDAVMKLINDHKELTKEHKELQLTLQKVKNEKHNLLRRLSRAKQLLDNAAKKTPKKENEKTPSTSSTDIDKLKRRFLYPEKILGFEGHLVHTYDSAKAELVSKGVRKVVPAYCYILEHGGPEVKLDKKDVEGIISHYWEIPSYKDQENIEFLMIPPPAGFYVEDAFPWTSDKDFDAYMSELRLTSSADLTAELYGFLGILKETIIAPTRVEPQSTSDFFKRRSIQLLFKCGLVQRELIDQDSVDIDLFFEYIQGWDLHNDSSPSHSNIDLWPDFFWKGSEVTSELNDVKKLTDALQQFCQQQSNADTFAVIAKSIISKLEKLDSLNKRRVEARHQSILKLIYSLFMAGMHHSKLELNESQINTSLAEARKRSGKRSTDHTIIFEEIVRKFENDNPLETATPAKVRKYIEKQSNGVWSEALNDGGKASLKSIIYQVRSR